MLFADGFCEFSNKEYLIFSRLQLFVIFDWVFIKQSQDTGTKKNLKILLFLLAETINFVVKGFVHIKFVLQN